MLAPHPRMPIGLLVTVLLCCVVLILIFSLSLGLHTGLLMALTFLYPIYKAESLWASERDRD